MILKKLELKNFCQHKHICWELPTGIIGITGPNGAGKSNAVKAAYANLTNDYSRNPGNKSEHIRDGTPSDGESYISAVWEHLGSTFELQRWLRPEKHSLIMPGCDELKRATDIDVAIESHLGISKQLLDTYVFVPQWQMFEFLNARASDRAKLFSHLCKTTVSEAIWNDLGAQAKADQALVVETVDELDELRAHIKKLSLEHEDKSAEVAKSETKLAKLMSAEKARELLDKMRDRKGAESRKAVEAEKLETSKKNLASKSAELKVQNKLLADLDKQLVKLKPEYDAAVKALADYDALVAQEVKRKKLETELAELESSKLKPPKPPAYLHEEEKLAEELTLLKRDFAEAKKIVTAFESGDLTKCPTCGTPVSELHDHIRVCRELVTDAPDDMTALALSLKTIKEYHEADEQYQSAVSDKKSAQERLQTLLQSIPPAPAAKSTSKNAYVKTIAQVELTIAQQRDGELLVRKLELEISRLEAATAQLLETLNELDTTINACKVSAAEHKAATQDLAARSCINETIAAARAEEKLLLSQLERARDNYKRAQAIKKRSAKAKSWLEHLEELRSVFHREALPGIVASGYMSRLTEEINKNLDDFETPFRVYADEQLSFTFSKRGGAPRSAKWLSGGEMVALAISFRIAVNSIFAKEIGMLVLDEPTAGLDVDNLKYLENVLQKVGQASRSSGRQIIMITHESLLDRVFDKVIRLETANT